MRIYQLRIHAHGGIMNYVRRAFTVKTEALRAFRKSVNRHSAVRHRIDLYAVTVPDRLLVEDWLRILSDEDIPGLAFERIRQSHKLTDNGDAA